MEVIYPRCRGLDVHKRVERRLVHRLEGLGYTVSLAPVA
jgi:hypothetical protein